MKCTTHSPTESDVPLTLPATPFRPFTLHIKATRTWEKYKFDGVVDQFSAANHGLRIEGECQGIETMTSENRGGRQWVALETVNKR